MTKIPGRSHDGRGRAALDSAAGDETMTHYRCRARDCLERIIEADEARQAARRYVGEIFEGAASTYWVEVLVRGEDCDEAQTVLVAVHPDEPDCQDGEDGEHDWQRHTVQVHGGGGWSEEQCSRCGLRRQRDSWACDPETGTEGLVSIKYLSEED